LVFVCFVTGSHFVAQDGLKTHIPPASGGGFWRGRGSTTSPGSLEPMNGTSYGKIFARCDQIEDLEEMMLDYPAAT
jgi:hypothetical protein